MQRTVSVADTDVKLAQPSFPAHSKQNEPRWKCVNSIHLLASQKCFQDLEKCCCSW